MISNLEENDNYCDKIDSMEKLLFLGWRILSMLFSNNGFNINDGNNIELRSTVDWKISFSIDFFIKIFNIWDKSCWLLDVEVVGSIVEESVGGIIESILGDKDVDDDVDEDDVNNDESDVFIFVELLLMSCRPLEVIVVVDGRLDGGWNDDIEGFDDMKKSKHDDDGNDNEFWSSKCWGRFFQCVNWRLPCWLFSSWKEEV